MNNQLISSLSVFLLGVGLCEAQHLPNCELVQRSDGITTVQVPSGTATLYQWMLDGVGMPDLQRILSVDVDTLSGSTHDVAAMSGEKTVCTSTFTTTPPVVTRVAYSAHYPKLAAVARVQLSLRREVATKAANVDALADTLSRADAQLSAERMELAGAWEAKQVGRSMAADTAAQFDGLVERLRATEALAETLDKTSIRMCAETADPTKCSQLLEERHQLHLEILQLLPVSVVTATTKASLAVTPQQYAPGSIAVTEVSSHTAGAQKAVVTDIMSPNELERRAAELDAMAVDGKKRLAEDEAQLPQIRLRIADEEVAAEAARRDDREQTERLARLAVASRELQGRLAANEMALEVVVATAAAKGTLLAFRESDVAIANDLAKVALAAPPPLPAYATMTTRPLASTPAKIIQVFYATERESFGSGQNITYSNKRSTHDPLQFGVASVSVPPNHKTGTIESPAWYKFDRKPDSQTGFTLSLLPVSGRDFYADIHKHLANYSPDKREVFVFVHGFNNSFDEALLRTAQITADIGFDGAPIMYDWPSFASVWDYGPDKNAMLDSIPGFEEFLVQLSAKTGAKTINVIAHSMGNYLTLSALDDVVHRGVALKLNQLVLAAPDVDLVKMSSIIPELTQAHLAQHITMYASHADLALAASVWKNKAPTAGGVKPVMVYVGVDTLDATAIEGNILGHDYFASTRAVLADIAMLFKNVTTLPRAGLKSTGVGAATYWQFANP